MEKIGIFCSSSNRLDKVYYEEADRLGRWIGEHGKTLVCGGANCGLMETLAKAVRASGGHVLGVIPQILVDRNRVSSSLDEQILTRDLNERKDVLINQSDIILALPGSVGTLDEVFTVMAANTIGIHNKKVVFWNINGFWDDLFAMFEGMTRWNVVNKPWSEMLQKTNTFEEIIGILE
ncbi:MAG: TIGR00730 family Rossman fold protein [Bacteroidales bacterium]|nr:TIGR00730 family Rossman fold protein [Bacteroidales bacterium]